jgi:spore germination cell wall hydrolase CwlJ-like protein
MLRILLVLLCLSSPALADDVTLLARVTFAEACGEPLQGKAAVASVVLNRVQTPGYPKTLSAVVYQRNAFASVTEGSRLWRLSAEPSAMSGAERARWSDCLQVARELIQGKRQRLGKAIAFRVVGHRGGQRYFSRLRHVGTIGRHDFYAPKER